MEIQEISPQHKEQQQPRFIAASNELQFAKDEQYSIPQLKRDEKNKIFSDNLSTTTKKTMVEKNYSPERKNTRGVQHYDFNIKEKPAFITLNQPQLAFEIQEQQRTINVERQPPSINIGRASDIISVTEEPVNVQVTPCAPDVLVDSGEVRLEVEQKAPEIEVEHYMPQITLKMPAIKVFLELDGPPEIFMDCYQPNIKVVQSDPIIRFVKPEPKVHLSQPPPKLDVSQAPAQVEVIPSSKASIQVKEAQPSITWNNPEPAMRFMSEDKPTLQFSQAEPELSFTTAQPEITIAQADAQVRITNEVPYVEITPVEPTVSINHRAPKIDVQRHPVSVSVIEPSTSVSFGRGGVQVDKGHQQMIYAKPTLSQQNLSLQQSTFSQWSNNLLGVDQFFAQQGGARNTFVILNGSEQRLIECFKEEKGAHQFDLNLRNTTGDLLFKGESQGRLLKLTDSNRLQFGYVECNKEHVDAFNSNGRKCFSLFPSTQRWKFDIKDQLGNKIGSLHRPSKASGYDLKFNSTLNSEDKMLLLTTLFLIDSVFD